MDSLNLKALLKKLATATIPTEVDKLLQLLEPTPTYHSVIALYQSIWSMTYQQASDPEFQQLTQLSDQIALMNEQENLVPSELAPIEHVEALDLGGFPEAMLFPELLKYTRLKRLDLWDNNYSQLPSEFFELTTLEALYICDQLTILPPAIGQLCHLKQLDLNGNCLSTLPAELAHLNQLVILNLSHNLIAHFSLDLTEMFALKTIDLRFNPASLYIDPTVLTICQERAIQLLY